MTTLDYSREIFSYEQFRVRQKTYIKIPYDQLVGKNRNFFRHIEKASMRRGFFVGQNHETKSYDKSPLRLSTQRKRQPLQEGWIIFQHL